MIFVSRFTSTGIYPTQAKRLVDSLKWFDLRHDVTPAETDATDWANICRIKPGWILSALIHWRETICWIDADCEVIKLPSLLLNTQYDFAAYNWYADANNESFPRNQGKLKVSGGVMAFAYTAASIELLIRWQYECSRQITKLDDPCLDDAYNIYTPPLRTLWLPKSYNRYNTYWPDVLPVINHHYSERHTHAKA